jgi:glycosyltransferase involved in cell wall biosynthesis
VPAPLKTSGRDSLRPTYWTGIWEPHREGISKEVAAIRAQLSPRSPVVSFTPQKSALVPGERVLRIHYRRWIALRAAAVAIEPLGDVTHMFGGLDAAHFLLVLGRRPLLFTVTVAGPLQPLDLYDRVAKFVVESSDLSRRLTAGGISQDRVEVVYPGIDLAQFADVTPPPAGPFRILFASTPSDPSDIDPRGLGLIVELARMVSDIEILILWRPWGAVRECLAEMARREPPPNVTIRVGDVARMQDAYRDAHATVCCFEAGHGKSAPNSIMEGMASGRPVLATDTCGLADLISEHHAGIVTRRSLEALATGLERLRSQFETLRPAARRLAEREFDERKAIARYSALYRVLKEGSAASEKPRETA